MNVPKISSAYRRCLLFFKSNLRIAAGLLLATTLGLGVAVSPISRLLSGSAAAQGDRIGESALRQIEALMREKESRTPEQKKIDSQLLYRLKQKRSGRIAPGVENLAIGVQ